MKKLNLKNIKMKFDKIFNIKNAVVISFFYLILYYCSNNFRNFLARYPFIETLSVLTLIIIMIRTPIIKVIKKIKSSCKIFLEDILVLFTLSAPFYLLFQIEKAENGSNIDSFEILIGIFFVFATSIMDAIYFKNSPDERMSKFIDKFFIFSILSICQNWLMTLIVFLFFLGFYLIFIDHVCDTSLEYIKKRNILLKRFNNVEIHYTNKEREEKVISMNELKYLDCGRFGYLIGDDWVLLSDDEVAKVEFKNLPRLSLYDKIIKWIEKYFENRLEKF